MDDEIIELYKRNKAAMIVTLSPAIASSKLPIKMTKMTQKQQEASKMLLNSMIEGAKQALAHDIPIGLGTDCATPYVTQYDMWREIDYFFRYCGVSKQFALYTATLGNAEILGISKETGSIEVGKTADLIVVEKNPLEELRNLRHIEMIMTKGQLVSNRKIRHLKHIDQALDLIN